MSDYSQNEQPKPNPDMKSLERLVGTWKQSGDVNGETTYEWMEGGFFLIQRVNFDQDGQKTTGMEVIGHLQLYGEEPSKDIRSRYYGGEGVTFDYTYEIEGDTLTIWMGERGSPAYYKGTFSNNDNLLSGGWVYPGGGGYKAISTRVK